MMRKINAATVRSEFEQIMDRAVRHHDRFLVERDGESAVLILSLTDFVKAVAPAPDWLREIQEEAKTKGLDKLTMAEIDAEIAAARREKRERQSPPGA